MTLKTAVQSTSHKVSTGAIESAAQALLKSSRGAKAARLGFKLSPAELEAVAKADAEIQKAKESVAQFSYQSLVDEKRRLRLEAVDPGAPQEVVERLTRILADPAGVGQELRKRRSLEKQRLKNTVASTSVVLFKILGRAEKMADDALRGHLAETQARASEMGIPWQPDFLCVGLAALISQIRSTSAEILAGRELRLPSDVLKSLNL